MLLLCFSIREVAQSHQSLEQELAHAVNASSKAMDVVYATSKASGVTTATTPRSLLHFMALLIDSSASLSTLLSPPPQALSCSLVLQMVINVKVLLRETELLLAGKMSMVTVSSCQQRDGVRIVHQ